MKLSDYDAATTTSVMLAADFANNALQQPDTDRRSVTNAWLALPMCPRITAEAKSKLIQLGWVFTLIPVDDPMMNSGLSTIALLVDPFTDEISAAAWFHDRPEYMANWLLCAHVDVAIHTADIRLCLLPLLDLPIHTVVQAHEHKYTAITLAVTCALLMLGGLAHYFGW